MTPPEHRIKLCPENSLFRIDIKEGFGFWASLQEATPSHDGVQRKTLYFQTMKAAQDYFNDLFSEAG